jgi:hypothetical protein
MVAGATQTFTATVTNDGSTPGVTWSATVGSITAGGVYTAPTPVSVASATITATSKTDTTKTATATVTLTPIAVSVSPTTATLIGAAIQTFAATVSSDITPSAGVTWSVSPSTGAGTITAAGVYTAPAVIGSTTSATVTATSKTDTTKSASATITLTPISVSITTVPVAMVAGATQTFAATVTSDGASAGVTWSASVGSITAGGVYTAPTPVGAATATITATSKTDTTKSTTATVTLTPIAVSVAPLTPTLIGGATQTFTPTVTGDTTLNAGVTWTATTGSITAGGVYTAPAVIGSALSATVTATSKTDTTKTGTATVTLTPISLAAINPATASMGNSGSQVFSDTVNSDGSSSGVSWSIGSGVGTLTASSSTGVTYNAPATAITSVTTVTLTATSIKDNTKTTTATITLNPISVSIPTTPVAMIGGATQTFSATIANDGSNSGVTWSITSGGGSFSPTTTLTGANTTYTAANPVTGTSAVLKATSVKDPTQSASVTVTLTPIGISFTTPTTGTTLDSGQTLTLAAAVTNDGSASGASFATTGAGTVAPASATGNAPGTTLTATGTTASTVTVTATSTKDGTKTATTSSITVNPAMTFTTPQGALTAAATNTAYSITINGRGGTGNSPTFTLVSGSLPTGLSMSSAGAITGTVTGAAGTYTFTIHVTDQASTPVVISGTFSITVTATSLAWTNPASATSLPAATVGTAITPYTLVASGGTGTLTYSLNTGVLPAGITLNGATGVLSGTPTAPTVVAGNVLTFKVTDSASTPVTSISSNVTIKVNPVTLAVPTPTLPTGYVNTVYNTSGYQFTATGGIAPYTWTMSPTSVASGLTLSATGLLFGTPAATYGPATISVTATDSATNQQQTLTITPSLTVSNALTVTTGTTLPNGTVGTAYSQTLAASGGSGTGYSWTITSGASNLTAIGLSLSTNVISGTPTAGSATFTAQVTDSLNHTASAMFTVTVNAPLALPAPNPSTLPAATTTASYSGSIVATGGVGPTYTWTINSSALSTSGTQVSIGDGLSVSSNGSTTLTVSGTPTSAQTVSFTASVTDSASHTVGSITYSVVVSTTYNIGGQITIYNGCGTVPTISLLLTQGTNRIQTVTTDSNGNFTFMGIANGTYTVTPSISGPTSVFYPATQSVTVASSNITNSNFSAALGYTVSGTVSYSGLLTGQIYLSLTNSSCGNGDGMLGTSISPKGTYTIRGVPPGTYTLNAFMDNLGKGALNASNPTGSTATVQAGQTNANVALYDPPTVILSANPVLNGGGGFNTGAVIANNPITVRNTNGYSMETATSYTLQWSTSSNFTAVAGSKTFPATGSDSAAIWMLNTTTSPSLTSGGTFYFRAYGTSGGTSQGTYSNVFGPLTISASNPTGGNAVSGAVTFTGVTPIGPLGVGFFDFMSGNFYGQGFTNPVSAQAYTIQVPNGNYYFVGILDQNNDGVIDAGDVQNTNNITPTTISGSTTSMNLTLPTASAAPAVTTGATKSGSNTSYALRLQVSGVVKQPVAVSLSSSTNADGANVITPMDIALCTTNCWQLPGFQYGVNIGSAPAVGDTYTFAVTYSDTTTGNVTATVTNVLNAFATLTSPTGTSSTDTPSFSWTDPANASNYTYQFDLNDSYDGHSIWRIPGNSSKSSGLTSSTTSLTWGNDPTDSTNKPSSALYSGQPYNWTITVVDSNNNSATTQMNFTAH